jgi:prepilin-type processing-associated H-X9-DG protein
MAVHGFHDSRNALPPDRIRTEWASWAVLILPHLEQVNIYSQWNLQMRYFDQPASARENDLPVYFCPSRRSADSAGLSVDEDRLGRYMGQFPGGLADYASCGGNNNDTGALMIATAEGITPSGEIVTSYFNQTPPGTRITSWKSQTNFASITDGTSNTLLIGEKFIRKTSLNGKFEDRSVFDSEAPGPYRRLVGTKGSHEFTLVSDSNATLGTWPDCVWSFGGPHPGICNFVWVDGSVRSLNVSTSASVLQSLGQRSDGKVVTVPD